MIVVDTNIIAFSVLPGEKEELVNRVAARDPVWIAPPLWRLELTNLLATAMRLRDLPLPRAIRCFEQAERLVVDAGVELSVAERLEVAERGSVSAYDAEFIAVAERLGVTLVTDDRKLVRAFPGRVVALAEFAAY